MSPDVLAFIETFIAEHGYSPTVREISAHFGFVSSSWGHRRLRELEDAGKIERVPGRAIRIVQDA